MEPVILFASLPNLETLCAITVLVQTSAQSQCTVLQPQVLKCREIIFTEPAVLASPSYDLGACFHVVLQQSYFKTGKIQARLQKQGHQCSKPYRVLPSLYQSCLNYTMLAKMAPTWNKAGEWLIYGRDFLTHTGYSNAIKMKLNVNKEEISIAVSGTVVRFPPLQIEDLNLTQNEMQQIIKCTEDEIREVPLCDCWCHVLPSLKKGRLMTLSLSIPKESIFTSYRDLQRHWKNMYGYRLPDTDEDILYCQISFLPSGGGRYFTYPSVCLRSRPVQEVPRVDHTPILTTFLQDLHTTLGRVCGQPLLFQSNVNFACPTLYNAGRLTEENGHINLSSQPASTSSVPLRNKESLSRLYNVIMTPKHQLLQKKPNLSLETGKEEHRQQLTQTSQMSTVQPKSGLASASKTDNADLDSESKAFYQNLATNKSRCLHPLMSPKEETTHSLIINKQQSQNTTSIKLVPHFRPKQKQETKSANVDCSTTTQSKTSCFLPVFSQVSSKRMKQSNNKNKTDVKREKHYSQEISSWQNIPNPSITDNDFQLQFSSQAPKFLTIPHFSQQSKDMSKSKREVLQAENLSVLNQISGNNARPIPKVSQHIEENKKPQICESSLTLDKTHHPTMLPSPKTVSSKLIGSLTCSSTPIQTVVPHLATSWSPGINPQSQTGKNNGPKRKKLAEGDDTPKRPRAKPQVQDVDIESLARSNQLGKVNTVTLIGWLKERGIACRSKDKKSELIDKVYALLQATQPEQ